MEYVVVVVVAAPKIAGGIVQDFADAANVPQFDGKESYSQTPET